MAVIAYCNLCLQQNAYLQHYNIRNTTILCVQQYIYQISIPFWGKKLKNCKVEDS